ncbi:MAG: SAM-dependent methyltransferase [Thermoplasmata archaeon]
MAPLPDPTTNGPAESPTPAPDLLARLRARADPDGFVAFDRFMDVALYAPGLGYYEREVSPLGTGGDFYTAPHVHPLFARTLAREIGSVCERLSASARVRIVELGPGDGSLAAGILEALGESRLAASAEYVLIERSNALRRTALARARAAGEAANLPVRESASVAAEGPFAGVVLANELLDALPARRLRRTPSGWAELGVRLEGGRIAPAEKEIVDPVPPPPLPEQAEVGTVVELSSSAEALVREVADHLVGGRFLILDYGMAEAELLAAHPRGTLQAIRRHRAADDPLSAPGETDLSVFVNFTRLRAAARAAGWVETAFRSQAEALGAWGFPELFAAALKRTRSSEEEVRLRLAVKNLLFGFDRFRALELSVPPAGIGEAR